MPRFPPTSRVHLARERSGGRPSPRAGCVDACLQLHGGYGYMLEYPIARAYADARVNRIYGGSNEIMLEIVGRSLGLGEPRS